MRRRRQKKWGRGRGEIAKEIDRDREQEKKREGGRETGGGCDVCRSVDKQIDRVRERSNHTKKYIHTSQKIEAFKENTTPWLRKVIIEMLKLKQ